MKTTTIYSCDRSLTTKQLIELVTEERVNGPGYEIIDEWFPETEFINGSYAPLTPGEILLLLPKLVGKCFVTVNEQIILMMLREVRKGRMRTDELELWCGSTKITVDIKGDMIEYWDGFEMAFQLRFF